MLSYKLPRSLLFLSLLALAACHREPEWYPPPAQQHPIANPDPPPASMMVDMTDVDVDEHIVSDIGPSQGSTPWRWTRKRPTLKIRVLQTKNVKFVADFAVWDGTIAATGPVTISFFIGDKLLDKIVYASPGTKHFEKLVKPEWLTTEADTTIAAEIDKVYTSPSDGAKLGFIITRMGFVLR